MIETGDLIVFLATSAMIGLYYLLTNRVLSRAEVAEKDDRAAAEKVERH